MFHKLASTCIVTAALFVLLVQPVLANADFFKKAADSLLTGKSNASASGLSNADIGLGLKDALRIGTENVVGKLGTENGFYKNPKIRIPLPDTLRKVDQALTLVGMGKMTDDLELRINRAAEAATPKAKKLFVNAIQRMTINDAQAILTGPKDSATQYLKKTMSPDLATEIQPLIRTALADSGAVKSYDAVIGQYNQLPMVSGIKDNLNNYVVQKTMDGIFYYVAKEEAAIRTNPAKRTTDILKKVFAATR